MSARVTRMARWLAVAAVLAVGAAPLAGCGREADSDAQLIESPAPEEVRLRCAHCRQPFALADARPLPARQDAVACPHCGKPTSIRLRLKREP